MWPGTRMTDLVGSRFPIVQAPMAGAHGSDLTIAVCEAGGLGPLPGATLRPEQVRSEVARIRERTDAPFSLNFSGHAATEAGPAAEERWRQRLRPYFAELGVEESAADAQPSRSGFDEGACALVEELR